MVSAFALAFIMFKKLRYVHYVLSFSSLVSYHGFAALKWLPAFQVKTVKTAFHLYLLFLN